MKRRAFHHAALALALAPWTRPFAQAATAPRWQSNPFALGVASGMPAPDSVLLWTRLFAGFDTELPVGRHESLTVSYEIYIDEARRQPVTQGQIQTDAARAHSVHARVTGLQPGRDYWYRFTCGNAVSAVGHTRTAPAADAKVQQLRIALASCQHYEQGFFAVHREIARQPLDLVLFVGDYIYETSNPANPLAAQRQHLGGTPYTLQQYRQRHAQYKLDADLQAAHAAHPWLVMWDDHEVVNDYADDLDPFYTEPARFLQRRAAAYQAYFEHMPVLLPAGSTGWATAPLHGRTPWGQLAELWTLDCRQWRSTHACNDPQRRGGRNVVACDELADPTRSMLGAAQERWLADGLKASPRRWQLLAQTTQIAPSGLDPSSADGVRSTYTEAWDGYPEARKRLLQAVADAGQKSAVTLGGDVHHHLAAQLRLAPNNSASPVLASEFVTGAVTSRGLGPGTLATMRKSNPDLAHASGDGRGYALLQVTPKTTRCEFRATAYPVAADATLATQAVFEVASGRPGVEKA
ncbi:MAG: alkaline phosphatase D family protein [Pseudomonadota bacterium]